MYDLFNQMYLFQPPPVRNPARQRSALDDASHLWTSPIAYVLDKSLGKSTTKDERITVLCRLLKIHQLNV